MLFCKIILPSIPKCYFIAKDFTQQEGADHEENFNPITQPVTIRVVLSIVGLLKWHVSQLDAKIAFLQGP